MKRSGVRLIGLFLCGVVLCWAVTEVSLSETTTGSAKDEGENPGMEKAPEDVAQIDTVEAKDKDGNWKEEIVYRAFEVVKAGGSDPDVGIKAELNVSGSFDQWSLSAPGASSSANVASPGNVQTKLQDIDAVGEYELQAKCSSGDEGTTLRVIVEQFDLTAYRPQHGSGYFPFPKTAISEGDEEDGGLGPGIRINNPGDSDPAGEDDLIEMEINRQRTDAKAVLQRSNSSLNVYENNDATDQLPFSDGTTDFLPFAASSTKLTVWVEWADTNHGSAKLTVMPTDEGPILDTLNFHTFESMLVVLGGEDQDPSVPRDNSDGDQGIFVMSDLFYEQGYDVYLYNEDEVYDDGTNPTGSGSVFTEIQDAVTNRSVNSIAIFGYSHGGGSTYDLAWRLNDQNVGNILFTSYIDAIENDGYSDRDSETRRPPGTDFHVNDWQPNPTPVWWIFFEVNGDETNNADRNTEYPDEDHGTIDNETSVHNRIQNDFQNRNLPR